MMDPLLKNDIEAICYDILKSSKTLNVFPTPVDKIIEYAGLSVRSETNLSSVDDSFLTQFSEVTLAALKKIRGILDRQEKVIYLDLDQLESRQSFVKLHEVGHNVLPWQDKTLYYLDDDSTLDEDIKEQFEAEANYFASASLFQLNRFSEELIKLPLSLESSMDLAKYFGASIHATLRRYVEFSPNRCSLLVLEDITKYGIQPKCTVRNYFQSAAFSNEFGEITWNKELGYKWLFVQDYYFGKKYKKNGRISLETQNGSVVFQYHFFDNNYNAFVLFFPLGEEQKSIISFLM